MGRLIDFYATQVRVLRQWQGGPIALLKRLVITLFVATISFLGDGLDPDPRMTIERPSNAAFAVILIVPVQRGDPTGRFWPWRRRSRCPDGGPGPDPPGRGVPGGRAVGARRPRRRVPGRAGRLVHLRDHQHRPDRDPGRRQRRLVLRHARPAPDGAGVEGAHGQARPGDHPDRRAGPPDPGRPDARRVGQHHGELVRDGTHKLSRWEAILPSMTSASQAGILHGNNDGIPAFRWYERDRQHLMASSNPADATLIVSRISNGEGLLSNNGASICNLVTGDATRSYLTTAAIKAEGGGIGESQAFLSFFFSPTGYLRSFTLFLGEFIKELHPGQADAPGRDPAADAPRAEVRGDARGEQRPASGRQHVADHRGDVPRHQRHLRGLHRLRRARPSLRPGARRVAGGARRRGCGDRHAAQGRRGRAAALQVHRPLGPRPEPRRDLQAALRQEPRRVRPRA